MIALSTKRRALLWVLLGTLALALGVFAMRGYMSAEMLLNLANVLTC